MSRGDPEGGGKAMPAKIEKMSEFSNPRPPAPGHT